MANNYFEDIIFDGTDITKEPLQKGDYEGCVFRNVHLSDYDFSHFHFTECEFRDCDLSNIKLNNASVNDIKFINCKMLGIIFDDCQPTLFSIYIEKCILNYSSFFKRNLKKTTFKESVLHEVDFTEADMTGASFEGCDLLNAKFENTILEKADFRTAVNYNINPTINKLKKAKFSIPAVIGLLTIFDISIES